MAPQEIIESQKEELSPAPELHPEGGVRGWLVVMGAFLALFGSIGFLNAYARSTRIFLPFDVELTVTSRIGVFQTFYEQNSLSNYTASDISWVFAVQLALMWIPGPLFGRIIDSYGPAPVLYPCSILSVFALCMTSLADEYYQVFLAQGLGFGIGAGGVFTAAMVCVGQWFIRLRGLAAGIATVGSSLGGVIFPIFLNRVMAEVGFYGAVRYTALLVGITLAMSCCLLRARLPRRKWNSQAKWFDPSLLKEKDFALYTVGSFLGMWVLLLLPRLGFCRIADDVCTLGGDSGHRSTIFPAWPSTQNFLPRWPCI